MALTTKKLDWQRVGELVASRRAELRLGTQDDAAKLAGIGQVAWREVELGHGATKRVGTLTLIAMALQWPRDMLQRIAQGEDPPDAVDASGLAALEQRVAAVESDLGAIRSQVEQIRDLLPAGDDE